LIGGLPLAIDDINKNDGLLLINGDQLINIDIKVAVTDFQKRDLDGGIITFKSIHPRWSYVALDDDNMVIQTSEKRPISDMATAGCYYFKSGKDFVSASFAVIEKDVQVQGKYYISSTYNEMLLQQKKIGIYKIARKDYISFASYQMYENYIMHKRTINND
jgi:dTDP-glucose pyrophosphorylase